MPQYLQFLIILPMVFLAGFVDAIAGGGGLISLPVYMLCGLPVHNAIATNKMSSTMGTSMAFFKYAKSGFIPWRPVVASILFAFAGSAVGANLALLVEDRWFKILMLAGLPVIAFFVIRGNVFREDRDPYSLKKTVLLCGGISFAVGIYDGFYGPGTGTFLILLFTGLAHMKLTEANGSCKAINLATNVTALVVYLIHGQVFLILGLSAGLMNIAGNYLGARCFTKGGAKFTRPLVITVLTLFMAKIILELAGVL